MDVPEPNELARATDLATESKKFIAQSCFGGFFMVCVHTLGSSMSPKMHLPHLLIDTADRIVFWTCFFIALWCIDHLMIGAGSALRRQRLWNTLAILFVMSTLVASAIQYFDPDFHRDILRILEMQACLQLIFLLLVWAYLAFKKRRSRKKAALATD